MSHSLFDNSLFVTLILFGLIGCSTESQTDTAPKPQKPAVQLNVLDAQRTGIDFANHLNEGPDMHYFIYTYAYHGGGVAVGDVNSDGLPDLYFTANQLPNRLYLNKGNLHFEDVTEQAGVKGNMGWTTGTSMVDANADGLLDIYVCMSGMAEDPATRKNLLYINNGDGTFTDKATEMGLAGNNHTTMAYFADLDGDSDLDMYEVNHRVDWTMNTKVIVDPRFVPGPYESDRLYINTGNGKFEDRTVQAGIENKAWGLSAAMGDFNADGTKDIYVTNDFLEPDFLYIRKKDGSYSEQNTAITKHISFYGMGSDMADFNNDAQPDLCVLDMTPSDHKRSKQNMASMRPDQFFGMVQVGWHHQYMANTLQMNNGNGSFSEVAHLAGIDRTDWSWSPLFVDLDNDGQKDLFVTNGIRRDITNNDFQIEVRKVMAEHGTSLPFNDIMAMIPRHVSNNIVFRNNGNLHFNRANDAWNYQHKIVSTGAAYADLDGDGDMDLITNNLDHPASIIENTANDNGSAAYLQILLKGESKNPFAIGSSATLYTNKGLQFLELYHARGFQSSVEPLLHFGLGSAAIDSLVIKWYDGTETYLTDVEANSRITVSRSEAITRQAMTVTHRPLFKEIRQNGKAIYQHRENDFNDFETEKLVPHRQSQHGPALAVADVNGDGQDDMFIGGAAGGFAKLLLQNEGGQFVSAPNQPWMKNRNSEEIGAHFFDANGDGAVDLYVAAGSTEHPSGDLAYRDRLYMNDGQGNFSEASGALPQMLQSSKVVVSADIDADGDLDLFVAGRNMPGAYPSSPKSFILINTDGKFVDATEKWSTDLSQPGMITDAVFADITGNGKPDLITCGEWQPIRFYENSGKGFTGVTSTMGDPEMKGWWYSLSVHDMDNDGDLDIVAGNLGLNNKFHPSKKKPLEIYMKDFDENGSNDIVLAKHSQSECLPVRGRECSSDQMPFLLQKFPTFKEFANANMNTIYGQEDLEEAVHLNVTEFASMMLENKDGKFVYTPLPRMAQLSPIFGIVVLDVNHDGHKDLIIAGNMYGAEVETSRYDASIGCVLIGDGALGFTAMPVLESGFFTPNNTKALAKISLSHGKSGVVVGNNNGPVQVFELGRYNGR